MLYQHNCLISSVGRDIAEIDPRIVRSTVGFLLHSVLSHNCNSSIYIFFYISIYSSICILITLKISHHVRIVIKCNKGAFKTGAKELIAKFWVLVSLLSYCIDSGQCCHLKTFQVRPLSVEFACACMCVCFSGILASSYSPKNSE